MPRGARRPGGNPTARDADLSEQERRQGTTGRTIDSLARLHGPTLLERLHQAIVDAGMRAPEVIELGRLHQFPGAARAMHDMGWCLLLKDRALAGDFDTGLVLEVGRRETRRLTIEGRR